MEEYLSGDENVIIVPNDDSEEYEFRVNGAVCACQAYDGIKDSSELPYIFEERTAYAVYTYRTQQGPVYVY